MSRYPFAAVVGHHAAKPALLLVAVEPRLRGVLIASDSGSAKSTLARGFGSLLQNVNDSTDSQRAERDSRSLQNDFDSAIVELPVNITEDRLLGGLDLDRTIATGKAQISPGILAQANGRVLYADDINLLDSETAAHVANALDLRQVRLEREGLSAIHAADFLLVGTFNPASGEPCSQLRDRVGLIVDSRNESSADERSEIMDRVLEFEKDALSFDEGFALETAEIKSVIEDGRRRLPQVRVSKEQVQQIALVAMKLGVEGNRADVFALRTARANAALAGRDAVDEDDIVTAIQLVLVPRATTLPRTREEVARSDEPSHADASDEGDGPEIDESELNPLAGPIEDLIIQAIDARVQVDMSLTAQQTARASRTGKRFKASESTRGRYVRSVMHRTRDARFAIDATLRAAAPFQSPRCLRDESAARPRAACRVIIEPSDLRFKELKHRSGIFFIFAVDASGSMALNRMAQAKGALTRLLQQAYLHRDKVALISFRGEGSEVLLAPTRSVELAKRLVDALPAGGGTPLSAGLVKAIELARFARVRGMSQTMLVLFTDGRANVKLREGARAIGEELEQLGRVLRLEGITSLVVDTKSKFVSSGQGRALAEILGARYSYLARFDRASVCEAINAAASRK